jgi:hypothetical protein
MIIQHSNGETTDTDKLNDIESQLIEKMDDVLQFCIKNKIPIYAVYLGLNRENVWGIQNANSDQKDYSLLIGSLIDGLERTMNQKILIVDKGEEENEDFSE